MTSNYHYTPFFWPSLFTVLVLLAFSLYAWRHRNVPGALPFAVGCLFAALWVGSSIMENAALDVSTQIFWLKVQAALQLPAITAITCFVLEYAWPGRWLTRRNLALLSIAPLLLLVSILTNDLYHFMWLGFSYDGLIIPLRGPGNWAFITYGMLLSLIDLAVFTWLFIHSPPHRWPVAIMAAGQIVTRLLYTLEALHLIHSDLPLDVIIIASLFLVYAFALFAFHLFDPIPLAHQMVIEQLRDGMLVLDPGGRVTSLNPAAEEILCLPARRATGRPIRDLLSPYADVDGPLEAMVAAQAEVCLGTGAESRYYRLEMAPLKDWRGLGMGRLLLLHDVTEQKLAQAQMVEQQRAVAMLQEREQLARELHDSLGQVFAFVNAQGQAVRRLLSRGDIETADAYVGRLVDVAREADVDIRESILGLRATLSEQGLFPALTHYLAQYEKNYGIHADLEKPEAFTDGAFEPLVEVQLLRIVQEALSNVRKHAAADCVRVTFALEDGWARVTVRDDGQGFAPAESDDISAAHVGLRVMRERAEEVGGSLTLRSKPGQGTTVVVRVPAKQDGRGANPEKGGDTVTEGKGG